MGTLSLRRIRSARNIQSIASCGLGAAIGLAVTLYVSAKLEPPDAGTLLAFHSLDLSRFCTASSACLGRFPFKTDQAFQAGAGRRRRGL